MLWYVQADGVCKPHVEEPEEGAAEAKAADIPQLWYVQADGVCMPHVEEPEDGAAEASATDISQLPDLALELIFSAQQPNLARPACVCSSHTWRTEMHYTVAPSGTQSAEAVSMVSQPSWTCSSLGHVWLCGALLVGTFAGSCVSGVHVVAHALRRVAAALQVGVLSSVRKDGGHRC